MTADAPDDITVVRTDIEATHAELSVTVDALSDKLNVKRNAQRRAHDVVERVEPHRTAPRSWLGSRRSPRSLP